eukprot:5929489-Pleurochrysis_carterae.AAC.1
MSPKFSDPLPSESSAAANDGRSGELRLRQALQGNHRLLGGLLRKKAAVVVQVGVDFLLGRDVHLHVVVEAMNIPSRA